MDKLKWSCEQQQALQIDTLHRIDSLSTSTKDYSGSILQEIEDLDRDLLDVKQVIFACTMGMRLSIFTSLRVCVLCVPKPLIKVHMSIPNGSLLELLLRFYLLLGGVVLWRGHQEQL